MDTDTTDARTSEDVLAEQTRSDFEAVQAGLEDADLSEEERHLYAYLRMRKQLDDEETRIQANVDQIMAGIQAKKRRIDEVLLAGVELTAKELIARQSGKAKSIKTPFGTVGFRQSRPKVVIENEDAFALAAKDDPDGFGQAVSYEAKVTAATLDTLPPGAENPKLKIDKTKVKELIESTGVEPTGATLTEPIDTFYVK